MAPIRRRIARVQPADSVLVFDVQFRQSAQPTLGAVRISAARPVPVRGDEGGATATGGVERENTALFAALTPDQRGDLDAIAATMPGLTPTSDGVTAFGLPHAQNTVTLNGLSFPGAAVPRDIRTTVRVGTATYDPSRGWFGGAETRLDVGAGRIFSDRTASVTVDAPALQLRRRAGAGTEQPFTNMTASLAGSGSFIGDRLTYNYGIQASDHSASIATLTTLDADALRRAGLAPDSAVALLQSLRDARVPVADDERRSTSRRRTATLLLRINTPEIDPRSLKVRPTAGGVILYGWLQEERGANLTALTVPSTQARAQRGVLSVQGVLSTFIGQTVLHELRSAVSVSSLGVRGSNSLPAGRVLVGSDVLDQHEGFAAVDFGGVRGRFDDDRTLTWETQSEARFYLPSHFAHRLRVNADVRYDEIVRTSETNRAGTYSFNSTRDLAAGRPTSFTRAMGFPSRTIGGWNGFVSVGDFFRASPTLQLVYGGRLEGAWFTSLPSDASGAGAAYGVSGSLGPPRLHLSPRLGFTWSYDRQRRSVIGISNNAIGQFVFAPSGILRGGIGEFRSLVSPRMLADLLSRGDPWGGAQRLSCVGDAVPLPRWEAFGASTAGIPTSCAPAGAGTSLADAAPSAVLFGRSFSAPRSWRTNLSWTAASRWIVATVDGIVSLNLSQPSTFDLNFADHPQFVLSGEGRPVFVSPLGIDPRSGAVSPVEARRDARYGRVTQVRSDGRSEAAQLVVSVVPNVLRVRRTVWGSLSYALGKVRQRANGFDATTFESPVTRRWSRSELDVRHSLIAQAGMAWENVNVGLVARLSSGRPFTPLVNGDVNGDGFVNDRAFVPDPANADPELASAMRSLVRSSRGPVRRCLDEQLGRAARPNGCTGPWTAELNARLGVSNASLSGLRPRFNVSLNFANPLGALDQLLHGSSWLRGWGSPAMPDPVLLRLDGFDRTARRFRYLVNPRFGSTQTRQVSLRAPFGVTLDVKVDVGTPATRQQLDRWLTPGRSGHKGPRLSRNDLLRRYSRNVPEPYARIIAESDSLLLRPEQIEALRHAQAAYRVRLDSLWGALAEYLAALPDQYPQAEAFERTEVATDVAWSMGRTEMQRMLPGILDPLQLQMLPFPAGTMFRATKPIKLRFFVLGDP
ncbi:MAG: outer membrane beta-barrel protein [Gemmatimonadaceae bacterium]